MALETIATGMCFSCEQRDIGERTALWVKTVYVHCDMRAEAEETVEQSAYNATQRHQMVTLQQMKLARGFYEHKERTGKK